MNNLVYLFDLSYQQTHILTMGYCNLTDRAFEGLSNMVINKYTPSRLVDEICSFGSTITLTVI